MKLKFKGQQFQVDATASVCDVFEGRLYHDPTVYTVDPGRKLGIKNVVTSYDDLFKECVG